jgi:type IV secretory pathway protease TraF
MLVKSYRPIPRFGDNTTNSLDSRFFGAIPDANIVGKVSKIYRPLQRAGKIQ